MNDDLDLSGLLDSGELIPTEVISASPPEQISLIITQAQRAKLRSIGFDEAVIGLMKPEEAHRLLGLRT
jgi:hypothetical protein